MDFYDTTLIPPLDPGRDPNLSFANPYLACDDCGTQVVWRKYTRNLPCGDHADFTSLCPDWTHVYGCPCDHEGWHGLPPAAVEFVTA